MKPSVSTSRVPTILLWVVSIPLPGAELNGSDSANTDGFGIVSQTSNVAVVGAPDNKTDLLNKKGAAYLFRSVSSQVGNVTQNAKLIASDGSSGDQFGSSIATVSAASSGDLRVLVAAPGDDIAPNTNSGSAYLFRPASNATGTLNQNAKLQPTSRGNDDAFGSSVAMDPSLNGVAVIGSPLLNFFGNNDRGAAYLFNSLDSATGTINENAILYDTTGALGDKFGSSVALWNVSLTIPVIVGSEGDDLGRGSACYFNDVSTASGLLTQSTKLTASDGATGDSLGRASGLSGNSTTGTRYAVVGAPGDDFPSNPDQGSAYLYRIPFTNSATTLTQNAKLTSSVGDVGDLLGTSVSVNGSSALLGAPKTDGPGYACLYLGLDTASGTVNESVRIWPTDGIMNDKFGQSVSLSGDNIAIGATSGNGNVSSSGKAYTVSLSALTTLDTTGASRVIEELNIHNRTDWTIGNTRSNMTLRLASNATAEVPQNGTAIYIGRTNAATNNLFIVDGALFNTRSIIVGSGVNSGNELRVNSPLSTDLITVRSGSILSGNSSIFANLAVTGSVRPGNSAIATLAVVGDLTWIYGSPWQFDLAAANSSDRLTLTNSGSDFLKGTGTPQRQFDFLGSTQTGTFTLVTWTGITTFTQADFTAINLGAGLNASFSIVGKSLVATIAPTLSPLEQWRQTYFGNPASIGIGSDDNDADKDGIDNIIEYALGTIPTSAASKASPILGQAGKRLTLKFTPKVISGLTYSVQTSSNLTGWSTTNLTGLVVNTQFTWTDTVNITPGNRRFVRLNVSE